MLIWGLDPFAGSLGASLDTVPPQDAYSVANQFAAVLSYIKAVTWLQGKQTSTQRKCEWIMPSFVKKVEYVLTY